MQNNSIKILIIEDEHHAAKKLMKLLNEQPFDSAVVMHCDSIISAVDYLQKKPDIDLIFMDIRLGDGISFAIFDQVDCHYPIIFTTAYDEYVMKAFKVHSVDYLLKPIESDELKGALQKYMKHYGQVPPTVDLRALTTIFQTTKYKERFLIKNGNQLIIVQLNEINYIFAEDGYCFAMTHQHKKFLLDTTLDQVQKEIDPKRFFRINRSMLISLDAIVRVEQYFNSRYAITLQPMYQEKVIVAREKVKEFKDWLAP